MMIHFRRNALRVTVAALLSSAFGAQAADIPQVKVTVNDKQCEPMQVTVNAGKTQFIIQNHSQKALEWEILKGVMWWWKSAKTSRRALLRSSPRTCSRANMT